jgi:opacity protein-like surface antigen
VEYAYFNFGKIGTGGISSFGEHETQSIDVSAHTVKVGVNYRWGAP